jgi:hypothetical protein
VDNFVGKMAARKAKAQESLSAAPFALKESTQVNHWQVSLIFHFRDGFSIQSCFMPT